MTNKDKALIVYGMLIGEAIRAREEGLFIGMTIGQIVDLLLYEIKVG